MDQTQDLTALLENDDWLMGFARSLVGNQDDARDLVQDAYVAALQRGSDARALGPWLAGFVRFRAWGRKRRMLTEQDHAAGLQEEATADSASAPLELAELRKTIGALVLELPEPRRSAVHLTHIAQLPLPEVAQRLGIKKSTASHHVKRGLEDLRRKLDAEYGGDRRRWATPLAVTAARLRRKGVGAVPVGGVGLLAAFGAAVTVAAFLFWGLTPDPTSSAEANSARSAGAPATEQMETAPLSLATAPRSAAATAPSPPSTASANLGDASLTLFVLSADGEPLSGARWTLDARPMRSYLRHEFEQALGVPGPFEERTGITDEAGRIEVSFPGHLALEFDLSVRHVEHLPYETQFTAAPGASIDLGTQILDQGLTLTGTIRDDSGEIVLGVPATVRVRKSGRRRSSETIGRGEVDGATGHFEVAVPGPGRYTIDLLRAGFRAGPPLGSADLVVENDEPEGTSIEVNVAALRTIQILWTCDPRRSFTGMPSSELQGLNARGADSEPLEVESATPFLTQIEDPGGAPATLMVSDPRFETIELEGLDAGATRIVQLRGTGTVLWGADGTPLEDVQVLLRSSGPREEERVLHDGRSLLPGGRLTGLVPGTYEIRLRSGDQEAWGTIEDLAAGEERAVDVTLEATRTVHGRVVDTSGAPVVGAIVGLCNTEEEAGAPGDTPIFVTPKGSSVDGYGFIERTEIEVAVTDEDGRFAMDLPTEGVHMVLAEPLGGGRAWSDRLEPGADSVEVVIMTPPPAHVSGTLSLPAGVDPAVLAIEFLTEDVEQISRIPDQRRTLLDDLGKLRALPLAPGRYDVVVRDRNSRQPSGIQRQKLAELELLPGEERVLSLSLSDDERARVTVRPAAPSGTSPCRHVAVVPLVDDRPRWRGVSWLPVAPDGSAGPFRVRTGDARVYMMGDDWVDSGQPGLRLEDPGDVLLTPQAVCEEHRARVLVDGEPARGRRISVRGLSSTGAFTPRFETDDEGWVTLRIAPGEVRLSLPSLTGPSLRASCTWPSDEIRF